MGRGRPVVFLHGWVGSWKCWTSVMKVVSTSYSTYALDFWGFGDTARNELKYSLDEQVKLLEVFLNELGIGKIVLVGHGLGGLVAMKFATHFRQRVDRIMAVSCPLYYYAVNARLNSASPHGLSDWLSNRSPEAMTALSDAPKADARAIAASLAGLQADNLFGNFRNLDVPCLLVYSEKDQAVTLPPFEAATSTYIHSIYLDGSGHFPMIEETVKFNRLLTDFLALPSGISPSELQMKDEWKRRVR